MSISVSAQLSVFLLSALGGAAIGLLYDFFRALRRLFRTDGALLSAEDILFWILSAIGLFWILYRANYGELHGYVFFGAFLGAMLLRLTVREKAVCFFSLLIRLFLRMGKVLIRILALPFIWMYRIFCPFGRFISRIFGRLHTFCRRKRRYWRDKIGNSVKKYRKRRKMY